MLEPASIIPQLTTGISGGGFLFILYLAFQLIFNKKLRTPADDQARIEFGVKVLQDRLTEATADRATYQATINWMREELTKRENDATADYDEKKKLRDRIEDLEERDRTKDRIIKEYDERINALAGKLARGEAIILADIYGGEAIEEIENTRTREQMDVA